MTMKVFNVGILEALLIFILALVVLGPKKAINAAKDVGIWVRKIIQSPLWRELVTASNEIRDFPKKVMDDVELQKLTEELDKVSTEIKKDLKEIKEETKSDLYSLEEIQDANRKEEHPNTNAADE